MKLLRKLRALFRKEKLDAEMACLLLLPRSPDAVARGNLEPGNQSEIHDLVVVRSVVAVNEHFAPAWGQGDEVLMLDGKSAAIGHVNHKRAKGAGMHQFSNRIRLHAANLVATPGARKRKGRKRAAGNRSPSRIDSFRVPPERCL